MFVSSVLAAPLCVAMCLHRPLRTCLRVRHTTTENASEVSTQASLSRWLTFWTCAFVTVLPLHALQLGAYGIPLRWELSLMLLACYAHDDARGAQTAFDEYLVPAMRLACPRALQAYVAQRHVPRDEDGETDERAPGERESRPPRASTAPCPSGLVVDVVRRRHPSPCSSPVRDARPADRYDGDDALPAPSPTAPAEAHTFSLERESSPPKSEPMREES